MVMRGEYLTKSLIEMFKVGDLPAAIRVIRSDIIKKQMDSWFRFYIIYYYIYMIYAIYIILDILLLNY